MSLMYFFRLDPSQNTPFRPHFFQLKFPPRDSLVPWFGADLSTSATDKVLLSLDRPPKDWGDGTDVWRTVSMRWAKGCSYIKKS